jgi:hypothetical protein
MVIWFLLLKGVGPNFTCRRRFLDSPFNQAGVGREWGELWRIRHFLLCSAKYFQVTREKISAKWQKLNEINCILGVDGCALKR